MGTAPRSIPFGRLGDLGGRTPDMNENQLKIINVISFLAAIKTLFYENEDE